MNEGLGGQVAAKPTSIFATAKEHGSLNIDSLPNEIIASILEVGYLHSRDHNFNFRNTVSLINHRWREIVLNTPTFWATLDITGVLPADHTRHLISLSLKRSKGFPLNISFTASPHEYANFPSTIIDEIGYHSERWNSVTISTPYGEDLLYFTRFPALNVRYLNITTNWIDTGPFFHGLDMPHLTSLVINRGGFEEAQLHFPFPILTTLELHDVNNLSTAVLEKILEASPVLENLLITSFHPLHETDSQHNFKILSLPSLLRLDVAVSEPASSYLPSFLQMLMAPSLQSLALRHISSTTWDLLLHSIVTSGTEYLHLRSLELTDGPIHESQCRYLPFPQLTHLILHKVALNPFVRQLTVKTEMEDALVTCPMLRSITVSCDRFTNRRLFHRMVETRKLAGFPITKLILDKDSFGRNGASWEWLQHNVEDVIESEECEKHRVRCFGTAGLEVP